MRIAIILLLILCSTASILGQTEADTLKKVRFAAIPMVNYNPSFGVIVGAMGNAYYKLNASDTISPSSSTGLFGMFTTNGTYFTSAFQQFYLRKDNWRIMLAAGLGKLNFQYWQELPVIGGQFIGFGTEATFMMAKIERKVFKKLYAGIQGTYTKAKTEFDVPDFVPDSLRFDERNMNNLGYQFNYDMREHQMNPRGGYNIVFKNSFYREWINSGNNFEKFELTYNHYYKVKNERNILAFRVHAAISTGDVPFQGQNVVGNDDIRGYSAGKYRNNEVYAIQTEYRWSFYKKLGMVGFLGIASAVEKIGDIPTSEVLPGIGVGFRYMMIPKERINVGVDVATGKDDWGLYFRIGESFGR